MYIDLEKGEEFVELLRKSFLTVLSKIFIGTGLFLPGLYLFLFIDNIPATVISFSWMIVILSYFLYSWLVWHNNIYIITNKRVVEIGHKSLFRKEINELPFEKIDDISFAQNGIGASIFGYGTLKIYSKSPLNINIEDISDAKGVKDIIMELKR